MSTPLIPIAVVSQEEAEQAAFLVCMAIDDLPGGKPYFQDDLRGTCAHCQRAIIFRPHAPQRPTNICRSCAVDHMDGGRG